MLTYHGATHLNSGSDRLSQVIPGTVGLEASGGLVNEVLVLAQALGIIGSAGCGGNGGQTGKGTAWKEKGESSRSDKR